MEIREFLASDSISELTELIHSAYKPLAEMGLHFWGSWQGEDITQERINKAHTTLIAIEDDKIVATISLNASRPDHPYEHYREAWYFGQFAVKPELQRSGIGSHLLGLVEERARNAGATRIALDTAETAYHLISYYEKRGYSFVQYQQGEKVNYRSVIMSKQLSPDPGTDLPGIRRSR